LESVIGSGLAEFCKIATGKRGQQREAYIALDPDAEIEDTEELQNATQEAANG
jgi:hypothetical protein